MTARVAALLLAAMVSLAAATAAAAQTCPAPLDQARRLVLVDTQGMNGSRASMRLYQRDHVGGAWHAVSAREPALIGRSGMAWSPAFRGLGRAGEPVKTEGDKRTPAGFYRMGGSFGFAASDRRGYTRIAEGMTCVDDPQSAAYNTVTTRAAVGDRVSGENMWRMPEYRHGLFVDYPTERSARGGSCIFVHLWLPGKTGTGGCVALPEARLKALQDFSASGAVLAILPGQARTRLGACLPQGPI